MSSSTPTTGESTGTPQQVGWKAPPQYDESTIEMDKIRRRKEIRLRLKAEFNRLYYNPYKISSHIEILDPAVQRFMAMRASMWEYWKPSWKSFFAFAGVAMFPIWAFGFYINYTRNQFDKKCRTGEIPVEKRTVKVV